jgi:hypothetical protein
VILSLTQLYRYTLEIFLFSTATFKYKLRRIGQQYSTKVAFFIFQSLKRIQPLPVCAGFFICIRNSFRWPNYIVTLPRYFSFRLSHLSINTGPPSDELDNNIQRKSHFLFFSQWNGCSHFRSVLNWFRN